MLAAPPLTQSPQFAAALSRLGGEAETIRLPDAETLLLRRRLGPFGRVGAALRGPLWADGCDDDRRTGILRDLGRRGLWLVEAESGEDGVLRRAGFRRVVTPAHVAEIDLTGTGADRRARMKGKWRNRLHRAEATGIILRDMPFAGAPADWLIRAEGKMRAERGYRAAPPALALAWAAADPSAARLFVAEQGGGRLAAMLFLIHGRAATYQLGWSGEAGRALSAHHLILATAADWLADRGIRRLDLGTVDTGAAPGLARFKIGAGARVRALGGSWLRLPGL